MLVNLFSTIYVPIKEENVTKMRILWFFDGFRISKKRHFRPKSSILTTFCLPDKKIFAYKFSARALNFPKIDIENRKTNKNKIEGDPLKGVGVDFFFAIFLIFYLIFGKINASVENL